MSQKPTTAALKSAGTNPLWDFSLAIYGSSAVQQACLALQDGDGVDVNILLCVLYAASTGRGLAEADVRGIVDSVEAWRVGVVVPLRTARRNLKAPPVAIDEKGADALRTAVKKAELEAERLQQFALYAGLQATAGLGRTMPARDAARGNVTAYGAVLGRQLAKAPVDVMLAAFDALVSKA